MRSRSCSTTLSARRSSSAILAGVERDFDARAEALSIIWFRTLFPDRVRDGGLDVAPGKRVAARR